MLRRLISAVFVLSLVLALCGTAISDVVRGELNPVIKVDPTNPKFASILDARPEQPTFKKPEDALKALPPGMSAPTPPYFYDVQDYTNGVPYYYWPIPDAYGDDLFNMRFTSDGGYDCEVIQAHYLMYGTVMTGTPDMRCYIWDDDGFGFPFAKLDSVDIPYATLLANTVPMGYVTAVFPGSYVFSDGEEHHLGWTMIGVAGDTLAIVSDDATPPSSLEERASEYWSGMWGTMLNDWGIDVSFFILNERNCEEIPYTDCYWQYYYANLAYYWKAPHPDWGDEHYAMRYSVGGRETLQFIDVAIYDNGSGLCGNDDVIMTVYDDDGAGLPGTQLTQTVVPGGSYVFFPAYQRFDFDYVLTPQNNITSNDFHIAFSSSAIMGSGDYECCLSSDGTDGVGRSSCDEPGCGPGWSTMLSCWGVDVNFLFDAYLCKDEYYECAWDWCYVGVNWFWRLPDAYGDYAHAQKFPAPGEECQVMDVVWYLYDNGDPDIYTYQSEVQVYTDAGGLPGTKLAGITIGPGSSYPYVLFPGGMLVDFEPLGVFVSGEYWVGIESFAPDEPYGIRTLSDNGGGGCVDGLAENYLGTWELLWPYWGGGMPQDIAAVVEEKQCCIPFGGLDCYPSEDWPTHQRDYARTGHSMNAVEDAWCDLTINWSWVHPTLGSSYPSHGPIIAFDKVVQVYSSSTAAEYKVFDLYTGAILYTLSGAPDIGYNIRCTPTVDMITGYPDPILFTSGGTRETISAWDFNTGGLIWSRTASADKYGTTTYGRFIVLDIGGQDVLFWGTDDGYIVGADALTGVTYPGYPVSLPLPTYISGATDGENLFYNTYGGTTTEGDVYSINAATATINWALSSSDPLGLHGDDVWTHANGYYGDEGFTSGIMYDNGNIYTNSRAEADHPTDGLFYSIKAFNGMVNYAVLANRVFFSTPIMDRNHVYMPSLTRWASPPAGGNLLKVHKNSGSYIAFLDANGDRYYTDAVVSCEPDDSDYPDDLIFAFSEWGFLECINSVTFEEVFRRRVNHCTSYGCNIGMGGAIAHDDLGEVHVVFTDYWGCIFDMTKQDDRPRLQVDSYNPATAVEFGSDPMYHVSFPDIFTNTGCADLHFDGVNADEDDCGLYIPEFASAVDPNFMDRADRIADDLARDAFLSKYLRPSSNVLDESGMHSVREMDFEKENINRAAAGWPPYLVSVDTPFVSLWLSPGAYAPLALTVNQPMISRGPQCFYLTVSTNDPDFFMCDPSQDPCLYVCLVGGCLIDTTTLTFGVGCANEQLVTNTGRLGTGDWGDGPAGYNGFLIDGDGASYYQGAYVYAVDTFRIAVHTQDWTSGGGEADAFVSMQPDPNWCDNECKPYLMTDEPCGEITRDDGDTYETILVDKVCKSFLDSVQNFDDGSGWDWEWWGAPFDNALTMGLYCNGAVYAACDVPELANVTVEVLQFYERNGNPVEGWYLGEVYDCDNGADTTGIDRSISTAWTYNTPAMDQAWGHIKIPFGCVCVCESHATREPLLNIWGTYGQSNVHGLWDWYQFWDACYSYMAAGPGHFSDGGIHGGDEEAFVTFAGYDFAPHDTFEIAIAHFALHDMADASSSAEIAPLAVLVNQWAGWGRGDVNNDGVINLADIIYLAATVNGGPGAVPFKHLSDVNNDGAIDALDVNYLINFYFNCGVCPIGAWICDP
jgi:WD40 repeat protein